MCDWGLRRRDQAFAQWVTEHGLDGQTIGDLRETDHLRKEIQAAVDQANESVSRAESIREFVILSRDLSIEEDELTPTLKVRRSVVEKTYADAIDQIYSR